MATLVNCIVRFLFDYVSCSRTASDHDDMSWFQAWNRGIVHFTDAHNYENHTNYMTCEVDVLGHEILYFSGRGSFGGREKLSAWVFGKRVLSS